MDAVKAFNSELAGLYECKPPISKAKMTAITKGAIRAIKFYKHVVQSVEKFIQKCKTEYKIPGLYVIDSIVRQSRHQFGIEKDVFAPRFAKNIRVTFFYLFKCPQEDKSKVIRVLNLWQKNQVFVEDIIQPLFDLADPNSAIQKEVGNVIAQKQNKVKGHALQDQQHTPRDEGSGGRSGSMGMRNESSRGDHMTDTTPTMTQQVEDESNLIPLMSQQPVPVTSVSLSSQVMSAGVPSLDPALIQQIQQILMKAPAPDDNAVGVAAAAAAAVTASLAPPVSVSVSEEVKTQVIPGLTSTGDYDGRSLPFLPVDTSQPPPGYMPSGPFLQGLPPPGPPVPTGPPTPMAVPPPSLDYNKIHMPSEKPKSPLEDGEHSESSDDVKEVLPEDRDLDRRRSHSRSRSRSRRKRRSRSRSRSRSKSRHRRSRSRSRGRRSSSRSRRRRSRSRDRDRDRDRDRRDHRDRDRDKDSRKKDRDKEKLDPEKERQREKEREKEEERKKRGLPPIKSDFLSVCSTTLWVGHLSKLVHQEELSDTFGEYGDIVKIDLIPPRGCAFVCMNRRQDAARALNKLKNHKMHNKAITLAWAPGKGVKGKEFKDYWEVEVGCSYIPYHKLITMSSYDLDSLEDGGMIDEETVPEWLRGRYGLESTPAPGPMPGFVPIGVPPGHPPNSRGQEVGPPPMPPLPPPEKNQDRDGSGPGLPNPQALPPPNMLPPPFGLPNMPPPQVGPGGPGGMPPLPPQGLMPPNLPPMGVPPPLGLPPLGVHPPVSSILGQPLIGAIPNRAMLPPGSNMPNSITTMANTPSMLNSSSHETSDMDIEMEDVEKNLLGKENGLLKDKDDDRRELLPPFERRGARSPSIHEKMVERLKNIASGIDVRGQDRFERERRERDRDMMDIARDLDRESRDRDRDRERDRDRDRDMDEPRGRDRFGPDAFSAPPPGFPQLRPNGPPNFRPDGPNGPNGPNGRLGPGGFNNFVPVPGFGPGSGGGGGSGVPPRMLSGPPPSGPHGPSGIRGEGFGPMGLGMLSGPNGPAFGPRGMSGPGGFNGPRGLLGPPPININLGSLLGGRPPLVGEMGGRPNGPGGPGGMPGQRPGMWMDGPGGRFPGLDPHGGPPPQGLRDGLPDRPPPWENDRPNDMDRFRDDRMHDDRRDMRNDDRRDMRNDDRRDMRNDDRRDMRSDDRRDMRNDDRRDMRSDDRREMRNDDRRDIHHDDRRDMDRDRQRDERDDRSRDSRDSRGRDERERDDRSRDSRSRDSRDDRSRNDPIRNDRSRNDRYPEDRYRDDRSRSRDSRPRDDRYRDERSRDMDRPWDSNNRYRDDRSRDFDRREEKKPWEKSRWGPQVHEEESNNSNNNRGNRRDEPEPGSWDIWAKMATLGKPGETPLLNPPPFPNLDNSKGLKDSDKLNEESTKDENKEESTKTDDDKIQETDKSMQEVKDTTDNTTTKVEEDSNKPIDMFEVLDEPRSKSETDSKKGSPEKPKEMFKNSFSEVKPALLPLPLIGGTSFSEVKPALLPLPLIGGTGEKMETVFKESSLYKSIDDENIAKNVFEREAKKEEEPLGDNVDKKPALNTEESSVKPSNSSDMAAVASSEQEIPSDKPETTTEDKVIAEKMDVDEPIMKTTLDALDKISEESQMDESVPIKEVLPVDTSSKEDLPVDDSVKEHLPVDDSVKEHLPVDNSDKEIMSVDTSFKEDITVNTSIKEDLPVDTSCKDDLPIDKSVNEGKIEGLNSSCDKEETSTIKAEALPEKDTHKELDKMPETTEKIEEKSETDDSSIASKLPLFEPKEEISTPQTSNTDDEPQKDMPVKDIFKENTAPATDNASSSQTSISPLDSSIDNSQPKEFSVDGEKSSAKPNEGESTTDPSVSVNVSLNFDASMNISNLERDFPDDKDGDGQANEGFDDSLDRPHETSLIFEDDDDSQINED